MMWLLEVATAGYGEEAILRDVRVEFERGSFVLLIGGNAAGKSTLLKTLVGLVPEVSGSFIWGGGTVDLGEIRAGAAEIAYLPQERVLFPHLTVAESLQVAQFKLASRGRAHDLGWLKGLIPRLEDWQHRFGADLSAGQRQLVGLALALVRRPKLALLDEPCAGLDAVASEEIVEAIQELRRVHEMTVMVAEHRATVFARSATSVIGLRRGKMVFTGSPVQLEDNEVLETVFGLDELDYDRRRS